MALCCSTAVSSSEQLSYCSACNVWNNHHHNNNGMCDVRLFFHLYVISVPAHLLSAPLKALNVSMIENNKAP